MAASLRLFLPGHLAPLIGHARPPDFLSIERSQNPDLFRKPTSRARTCQTASDFRFGIIGMQQITEALMSGLNEGQTRDPIILKESDAGRRSIV